MITAETIRQTLQCDNPSCECHKPNGKVHCPTPGHPDIHPSFSVDQGSNGKVIVKCQSQCRYDQNLPIDALKARNLWPSNNGTGKPKYKIIKTYDYQDPAGKMVYQVCRTDTKQFPQRRPDPAQPGKWIWIMTGVTRYPYRLPQVLEADTVYVVEGEKDCDRLVALGLTATTNAGGASKLGEKSKWREEFNQFFKGKTVFILPDNDEPGRAHAQNVARNLRGAAAVVRIVDLPGLPPKGDVSDWLAAGGTVEQLKELADAAPDWEPQADPSPKAPAQEAAAPTTTGGYSLSDLGNARRLVAQHGQDLHYCHLSKKWWIWTGKVWAMDTTGEVIRRAKLTVAQIYQEAAAAGEKEREAIAKFALRSEHDQRIRGMIRLAESEPGIPVSPGQFDANPWLLNCLNGTVDLKTGKLRPHDRADLVTRLAPVEFDPTASCKLLEAFLDRIQKSNQDVISFIQRILGYALTGDCREQCLFLLWGSGANGKSTLLAIISAILGNYAMQTPTETLLAKQKGDIPNDIARLNGPRFVTALEVSQGRRLAESLIKQLTGQDTISARFLFGEYFDFKPQFKLFLGTNHKPVVKDTSHAMWRRLRLIPFPVEIPEAEQDKALPAALLTEAPGILAWMVRGCLSWQHGGLSVPDEVTSATGDYRQEMDVLADFISECCMEAPGASATAKELYVAYTDWAESNGEKRPLSQRAFGMSLTERGFERGRGTGGKGIWWGIGLKGVVREVSEVTPNPPSSKGILF